MFKFKRNNKRRQKNEPLPVEEALKEVDKEEKQSESDELETTLSIPESWNLTEEEKYVYAFHNSQSPKMKPNQLAIYGMELIENENDDTIRITGLIRSTIPQTISFEDIAIVLRNEKEEVIAYKRFDLSKLGDLPPNSARPWDFHYNKSDFIKPIATLPKEWSLAFRIETEHRLDIDPSWEDILSENQKKQLEQLIEQIEDVRDEVKFTGFSAYHEENGNLIVSVLIRNGYDRDISIEQLPLAVRDGSGEEVARGAFKLDNLTVKANTSKPWTFTFPKSLVLKDDIDLSRWAAYPIQK